MYLFSIMPNGYKGLVIPEGHKYADYDCLLWDGRSKSDTWKTVPLEWLEDDLTDSDDVVADFTAFGGGPIAVSERAYDVVSEIFKGQVEFLPTSGPDGDNWRLLNVTNVVDTMDTSKSQYQIYDSGRIGMCTHAHIDEPGPENKIFVVKGFMPRMFVDEVSKNLIESSGLTGALIREYLNPA